MKYLLILLLLAGCCTLVSKTPLPNFSAVDPDKCIYRGGQPTDEGFARLKAMGIKTIIKLNEGDKEDGGTDNTAVNLGLTVKQFPINTLEQLFYTRKNQVAAAVDDIEPYTYIHCLHGEDRTGVVCYFYRRKTGWSKDRACKEMLNHGFHKSLHGLWELVEDDE